MKKYILLAMLFVGVIPINAKADEVKITPDILSVEIDVDGEKVTIIRAQDFNATIDPDFAKTSRQCPPFCVQPMVPFPGIIPVGELEIIDHLKKKDALLIDARTVDWHMKGTIPGSINIPYDEITDHMDEFEGKPLILYCNGPWCEQSPMAMEHLMKKGYPAEKLLYYRGGMQAWKALGLTVVDGEL